MNCSKPLSCGRRVLCGRCFPSPRPCPVSHLLFPTPCMGPGGSFTHLEDLEAVDVQDAHHLPLLARLHLGRQRGVEPCMGWGSRVLLGLQDPLELTWMLVLMRFTTQSKRRL